LADVEIDPAHFVLGRALRYEHYLRLNDTGIPDQATAGLDDGFGNGIPEMLAQRAEDRLAIALELGRLAHVAGRESAAQIDHGKADATLGAAPEDRSGGSERPVPRLDVVLLRSDVKGDAVGNQAKPLRQFQDIGGIFRLAAEFARQRPLGAGPV